MGKRVELKFDAEARATLADVRDHDKRPYMRERAAAVLKVADGMTIREVARSGLLKPRERHTVSNWVHAFLERGLDGLGIKPGRGRKPRFFPPEPRGLAP